MYGYHSLIADHYSNNKLPHSLYPIETKLLMQVKVMGTLKPNRATTKVTGLKNWNRIEENKNVVVGLPK